MHKPVCCYLLPRKQRSLTRYFLHHFVNASQNRMLKWNVETTGAGASSSSYHCHCCSWSIALTCLKMLVPFSFSFLLTVIVSLPFSEGERELHKGWQQCSRLPWNAGPIRFAVKNDLIICWNWFVIRSERTVGQWQQHWPLLLAVTDDNALEMLLEMSYLQVYFFFLRNCDACACRMWSFRNSRLAPTIIWTSLWTMWWTPSIMRVK